MPQKSLTLRVELALAEGDKDAIEAIQKDILEALEMSESSDGRAGNMGGAAALLDVRVKTLRRILDQLGMTESVREWFPGKGKPRLITSGGVSHTAAEWGRINGINRTIIKMRIARGWSEEEAVKPDGKFEFL